MDQFIANASPKERQELLDKMEEMHVSDTQRMFNGLTQRCFEMCVTSFRTKVLGREEQLCVDNCTVKFMRSMQRTGARFAEQQYISGNQPAEQQ